MPDRLREALIDVLSYPTCPVSTHLAGEILDRWDEMTKALDSPVVTDPDTIEVYEDAEGGWRWRRKAPNHEIISDGGESYTRRDDAVTAAQRANEGGVYTFTVEADG